METQAQPTTRVRDEKTLQLLAQLKAKLYAGNISHARKAAHNLSWLQEDGFEILRDALLCQRSDSIKTAAAYGLRQMRGRMKPMALETLRQGLDSQNSVTRRVCKKTALLLNNPRAAMEAANANRARPRYNTGRHYNNSRTPYARTANSARPALAVPAR
jgi:hypothetical protein